MSSNLTLSATSVRLEPMRLIFLTTAALALLNASLIFWDALRTSALGVTLTVGAIFVLIGVLLGFIQHHLRQSLAIARGLAPNLAMPLSRLQAYLAAFIAGVGVFMLICLMGILSRFREGLPLFG